MKSIIDTLGVIRNAVEQYNKETDKNIRIALIGGYAAIYFGAERTTLDVDICFYSEDEEPGPAFYSFLKEHLPQRFNLRFINAGKDPADPLKHDLIIIHDSEGEYPRIDLLEIRYQWELEGLEQAKMTAKLGLPVMPMPYLTAMKLIAGGRKDELDIIDMLKVMSEEELKKAKELAKKIRRDKKLQTLLDESG